MLKSYFDIVIVGGGPAGLSAAISLRQQSNLSVLVIEAQSPQQERIGESCPPDIILLLGQLGLAKKFREAKHATCPGYASVWGQSKVGYNDFIVNPLGPAWRLDRKRFDNMLATEAKQQGAEIAWQSRFIATEASTDGFILEVINGANKEKQAIKTRYVIDASGSKARFAHAIGIKKQIADQLFALVRFANIKSGKISQQVHLEATPEAWWYMAALPNQRLVSMVVTEQHHLHQLQQAQHSVFENVLTQTSFIGTTQASLELTDKKYLTWPIYSGILEQIEGKNWIAIGDAAASYDPVAAQGIYKGIRDGIDAGRRIARYFNENSKPDSNFTDSIRQHYQIYLRNRAYTYALEQRWKDASFWRNRY